LSDSTQLPPATDIQAAKNALMPKADVPEMQGSAGRYRPYIADAPQGADAFGLDGALSGLAELAAHTGTAGALTIGVFGPAGSGKSFALNRLVAMIESLRDAAAKAGPKTPFISRLAVARIDAAKAQGNVANTLASAVFDALRKPPADAAFAKFADEIAASAIDPHAAARVASERLMELRRKLDAERQQLHELSGRKARLAETVLYQTSGSRIDSYARSNRSSIESRLRSFGFDSGDPVATYKDLVRDVAERGGLTGRVTTFLHAMWAFRGQTKLLVWAVIFFLLAWGLGHAEASQPSWIAWLRGLGEGLQPTVNFIESNAGWLGTLRSLCNWLGLAMVALNVVRAFRFVSPIFRGVSHLQADMDARRQDLDHLVANQARLVDDLNTDVETQARRADDAERIVVAQGARASMSASPFAAKANPAGDGDARGFLRALEAGSKNAYAPQRIVVAIDNVDALDRASALNFLDEATQAMAHSPFVAIVAADSSTLGGNAGDRARLAKLVQAPLNVANAAHMNYGAFVKGLLNGAGRGDPGLPKFDASASSLDAPMHQGEAALLEALSDVAGRSPRHVLRFLNIYRLARTRVEAFAPLAIALAVQCGGEPGDMAALKSAVAQGQEDDQLKLDGASAQLSAVLKATAKGLKKPITVGDMKQALSIASAYSL
jgi:hypothetical protein